VAIARRDFSFNADSIDDGATPVSHYCRAMRLPRFDYCRSGAYLITFCTAHREPLLAEVDAGRLELRAPGQIVAGAWPIVLGRHPHVRLLESVIMPDHVHALLVLDPIPPPQKSVCRLVGAVKTYSAARINHLRGTPGAPVWQRGFHDWIVRSPKTLVRVREYIANNPQRWIEQMDAASRSTKEPGAA
jgi:putative transposase